MGLNIISACHKHKVKIAHFRREENLTVIPFYREHEDCLHENKNNIETKDDQYQEEDWMQDLPKGYPEDEKLIRKLKLENKYRLNE